MVSPDDLADLAVAALTAEALLTPKPGLVDRAGSGAHDDMTLGMLLRSAEALRGTFTALARLGGEGLPIEELRARIGAAGRAGERAMLDATEGVNTHRGAIWTLGLLVTAAPRAVDEPDLFDRGAALARTPDPAGPPPADSNGRRAARRYGVPGAVGEAAAGFPHITGSALPQLRSMPPSACSAQHRTLLALIATVEDTCVLHRGGADGLRWMQRSAAGVLRGPTARFDADLARFAQAADRRHLSPGGSADLLAGALFAEGLARKPAAPRPIATEESFHAVV